MLDKKIFYGYLTSFIDFPGKYSASLFFTGCNLRCSYCFNKEVVSGHPQKSLNELLPYLGEFKKMFSENFGIVLSGGEPTSNKYFNDVVYKFKELNYPICLQTNGLPELTEDFTYNSIILSIKYYDDGIPINYKEIIANRIKYYTTRAEYKEIRIVNNDKKEEMSETLNFFEKNIDIKYLSSWNLKFVPKILPKEVN